MMRALWSAASGMTSQQTNVDVIANNLANVNTTSYKKETAQFKSLLYQTLNEKTTSANGETKPVNAQVGLGVRTSSIGSIFVQGTLTQTDKNTDFAISGEGFFTVRNGSGDILYTRDGSLNWSVAPNGGMMLATQQGYPLIDTNGNEINIPPEFPKNIYTKTVDEEGNPIKVEEGFQTSRVVIDPSGDMYYKLEIEIEKREYDEAGQEIITIEKQEEIISMEQKIALVQFANPAGLSKESGTMYAETAASGEAISEDTPGVKRSQLVQSYLEASNVNVADEMVNLIVAQRAYEMNSKAIQAADTMLGQANQLKS